MESTEGVTSAETLLALGGVVDDEVLAIASPKPAITDIGSENSANQCNPVTQLNNSRPIYKQIKHPAPNRISLTT